MHGTSHNQLPLHHTKFFKAMPLSRILPAKFTIDIVLKKWQEKKNDED